MAIITEARMQQLRGKYNQLNKEALLPGEFAICDDHNPIVRTNTGYKELLTADNAEYFENKVTDINNAISSTNEAVDKANKAVAEAIISSNDDTNNNYYIKHETYDYTEVEYKYEAINLDEDN